MEAVIERPEIERSEYERERGKPMPSLNHAYLQKNLLVLLDYPYRKQFTFLPEINLTMPQQPNAVPDIAIYPKLAIDFLHDQITMTQMPITAIEIVSSSQSNDDILDKFERYFLTGVQSCWLVMPSMKAVAVYAGIGRYTFFTDADTLTDPATGIELPLAEVFA
jgi:Uma2 family endonuclease